MTDTPKPVESIFCASLIALIRLNKTIAPMIVNATRDLAALRQTLKPLDPTFAETFAQNRAKKDTKPPIDELLRSCDELLQSLHDIQMQYPAS